MSDVKIDLKVAAQDFQKSVDQISAVIKTLSSEIRAVSKAFGALADADKDAARVAQQAGNDRVAAIKQVVAAEEDAVRAKKAASKAARDLARAEKIVQKQEEASIRADFATQVAAINDRIAVDEKSGRAKQLADEKAIRENFAQQIKAINDRARQAQLDADRLLAARQKSIREGQRQEETTIRADFKAQVKKLADEQIRIEEEKTRKIKELAKSQADEQKRAHKAAADAARIRSREEADSARLSANKIGLLVAGYQLLAQAILKVASVVPDALKAGVDNIDQFKQATIGTAAAMTNLADMSANAGKTWNQVFHQNLKATQQTFIELEKLSARYFASAQDLQLAYNAFAQRGIILRRTELEQLAQLTDLILLLTQGQQSTIQVQEEIRALVNANLRPTSQLAQLIKAFGKDVKQVAAEIRATGSLRPLEDILRGAQEATGEIQKTFIAARNGFETIIRQIGRIGLDQLYAQIVSTVNRITKFLQDNRVGIASGFAIFGQAIASAAKDVELVVRGLFQIDSSGKQTTDTFIKTVAAINTVIHVMAVTTNVVISLIYELIDGVKLLAAELTKALTPDIVKTFFAVPLTLAKVVTEVRGAIKGGASGAEANSLIAQTETTLERIEKKLAPLTEDFLKYYDTQVSGLTKVSEASKKAAAATFAPPTATPAVTKSPFIPTTEQLQELERAQNALAEAESRLGRAERTSDVAEIITGADTKLQGLRRTLALVEQGFIATRDSVQGVHSSTLVLANFIRQNLTPIVANTGKPINTDDLRKSLTDIERSIQSGIFSKLKEQLQVVRTAYVEVQKAARAAADKIIKADVTPLRQDAAAIRSQTAEQFEREAQTAQILLEKQRMLTQEILKSKTARKADKDAAKEALQLEEINFRNSIERSTEAQNFGNKRALIFEQIAAAKQLRTEEQFNEQTAQRRAQLQQEELRIQQAINAETTKAIKQNIDLNRLAVDRLKSARERGPQTDLEKRRQVVEEIRIQFTDEESKLEGKLAAIKKELEDVGLSADTSQVALLRSTEQTLINTQAINEETLARMSLQAELQTQLLAVREFGIKAGESVVKALTDSFEGKKTDFKAVFKGLADQFVQSSLKDTFQSFGNALETGFQDMMEDLAGDLPEDLGGKLGPAFSAGIGLIASFVLGQLLGDKGGEATAGNPTVGIQSTEQVRGLIGGETQIPIGLIGESLQDAFVTTNGLLMRIAVGVEGISSTDTNDFEQSLSNAFGSTLQTQG